MCNVCRCLCGQCSVSCEGGTQSREVFCVCNVCRCLCGQCSVSCEGGTQSREVFCTDGESRVDIALCGDEDIPSALQDCNEMECAAAGQ